MNKLSSVLGAAAVIAIAVVFILQFRPATGAQKADSGPACAANVGGACLSTGSFWAAYRLIGAGADPSQQKLHKLRERTAEGLLEQWLLVRDAKRLGITVSDDDVTAEIAKGRAHVSLPAAHMDVAYYMRLPENLIRYIEVRNRQSKKFDAKVAEKEIRTRTKLSPTEFREYQKDELIAARMRDLVRSRVRVGENEAYEQFSRDKSTATLDYARFDRRFYADVVVDGSQKAIDAFAEAQKDEIGKIWEARKNQILPECRLVREIYVKVDDLASDEEKAAAKKKMERAVERINKGEDFADVARAMSDDPSAARGGELGCFPKGKAPKPLEEAVYATAAGKLTNIQSNENGLWLFKVDQIAKDADAEKLGRAQVAKELYFSQEAERLAAEGSKQILAAVKGGKSLKDAIDGYLDDLQKAKDARTAGDKKPDEKKPAKDEKKKDEKAAEPKKDEGDRAPVTIKTHPNRPAAEITLPFNQSGDPIPGVKGSAELTKIAFGLEKPGDAATNTVPYEAGYLVVALKEKAPATKEQWDKDREHYLGAMRAAKANDALVAYMKRLRATMGADYKPNPEIVNEPKVPTGGGDEPMPVEDFGD